MLALLIIGQLLPWLVGCAWIVLLWRKPVPGRVALVLGYGYACGSLALTLWMRGLSAVGIAFGWVSIAAPILAATLIAAWLFWPKAVNAPSPPSGEIDAVVGPGRLSSEKWLWWLFLTLIAVHLVLAGLEILWRPLFPWDAWTQWATKARVWYEFLRIVPFTEFPAWLAGNSFTDAVPSYPANLPLLQVWACIALGRWDDSLMNLPSLSFALALGLGFYGQLRYAGYGALFSIAGTYAVVSLPFVDTHIALAGYADLPLAVYYGLAAIALWQWSDSRDRAQLVFALVLAAACPLTKNPGWMWILTLVPAWIIAVRPKHGLRIVCGLGLAAILALLLIIGSDVSIFSYRLGATFHPIWEPLWQNYFEFANWHLLWYLLPVLLGLNYRRLLLPPLLAGTLTVAGGGAFLFVVFSFSNAANWVADYSTVNRATLHLAPLLVFYMMRLGHCATKVRHVSADAQEAPHSI